MRKNVADTSITRTENPVYIIRCTFLAWNDFIWCTYVGGCPVLLISAMGCCSSSSLLHPPVIWFILQEAGIKTETIVGRKDARIKECRQNLWSDDGPMNWAGGETASVLLRQRARNTFFCHFQFTPPLMQALKWLRMGLFLFLLSRKDRYGSTSKLPLWNRFTEYIRAVFWQS